MGINQLTGNIDSGAYSVAIQEVIDRLNNSFGLHLFVLRNWTAAHTIAEEMGIVFDRYGHIIERG